jgi:hypothetical protein
VDTGLEQAGSERPAASVSPINFAEPVSEKDLTAGVGDKPEEAVPVVSAEQLLALQNEADRDNISSGTSR